MFLGIRKHFAPQPVRRSIPGYERSAPVGESKVENIDFATISRGAASGGPKPWKKLMKTAGIALMMGLTLLGPIGCAAPPELPSQQTTIERVVEQPAPPKAQIQREIVADYTAKNPAQITIQKSDARPTSGVRFDYTRAELDAATKNSLTSAELQPGDARFTAEGVDAGQASKQYHDPSTLAVLEDGEVLANSTGTFSMCANQSANGEKCASAFSNQVKHSTLSCVYRNEADGNLYRVVHRSQHHYQTQAMQKNVCGGHQLRTKDGAWTPYQSDVDSQPYYVNPANILQVQAVTQAEIANFGG